jgi:hypothetical protein
MEGGRQKVCCFYGRRRTKKDVYSVSPNISLGLIFELLPGKWVRLKIRSESPNRSRIRIKAFFAEIGFYSNELAEAYVRANSVGREGKGWNISI